MTSFAPRPAVVALLAFLVPCTAHAQLPTSSLAEASQFLQEGRRIEVTTRDGSVVTGSLSRISDAGVVLDVEGRPFDLPASTIAEISRRGDSLKNGLIIGLIAGTAGGLVVSSVLAGSETNEGFGSKAAVLLPLGVGAGVGLGVLFDSIFEERAIVFRAATAARIAFVPMVAKSRIGLTV
jgi:hypothetical protein